MRKILFFLSLLTFGCKNKTFMEYFNHGVVEFNNGNYNDAIKDLTQSIELNPNKNSKAYYFRGVSYAKIDSIKYALIDFKKSIELDSNNYTCYVERAVVKIKLGDYSSAIDDCDKATYIKQEYSKIYRVKALAYELLLDIDNSTINYSRAISLGEKDGEIFFKLALLKLKKDKSEEACQLFSKAGELGFMKAYEAIKQYCSNINNKNNNNSDKSIKNAQLVRTYRNDRFKFSFNYPVNWDVKKESLNIPLVGKDKNTNASFNVVIIENETRPLDIVASENIKEMKNYLNQLEILSQGKFFIQDKFAFKLIYKYKDSNNDEKLQNIVIAFVEHKTTYIFTFCSTLSNFNLCQNTFEQMYESIKID